MVSALHYYTTLPVYVGHIKSHVDSKVIDHNLLKKEKDATTKAVQIILLWSYGEINCWELVINATIQLDT